MLVKRSSWVGCGILFCHLAMVAVVAAEGESGLFSYPPCKLALADLAPSESAILEVAESFRGTIPTPQQGEAIARGKRRQVLWQEYLDAVEDFKQSAGYRDEARVFESMDLSQGLPVLQAIGQIRSPNSESDLQEVALILACRAALKRMRWEVSHLLFSSVDASLEVSLDKFMAPSRQVFYELAHDQLFTGFEILAKLVQTDPEHQEREAEAQAFFVAQYWVDGGVMNTYRNNFQVLLRQIQKSERIPQVLLDEVRRELDFMQKMAGEPAENEFLVGFLAAMEQYFHGH